MIEAAERLSDRHFRSIADLVEGQVGIQLPAAKRTMVEGRLRKRVRALGFADLDSYARHLFDEGGLDREFTHLVDCVTTNKTDFFREPAHFDFLVREAVPELLRERGSHAPRLKIWSAACSIGAEAYTAAMVLHDAARTGRFDFVILGTDISTEVLAEARRAIYPAEMIAPVPPAMRQRYVMTPRDPRQARARIVPELRRLVTFQQLNLMDASYPIDRDVDLIFCRNVLIYFDKPTQKAVLQRLAGHLRPGGYLILGHSESMAGGGGGFGLNQVLPTVFQA
jgi:chemotaxis methyl-accepting protein methylase